MTTPPRCKGSKVGNHRCETWYTWLVSFGDSAGMRGKAGYNGGVLASGLLCWSLDSLSDFIQTFLFLGMELREAWTWPGMRWRNWTCYPTPWWSICSSPPTAPASWFLRRIKTRLSQPRTRGWVRGRDAVPPLTSRWYYRVGQNL